MAVMWHSLRLRLLLISIIVVLIATGVTVFVATCRTTGEFERYVERRVPVDGRRLAYLIGRVYTLNGGWEAVQSEVEQVAANRGDRIIVVDDDGIVVADSDREAVGNPRDRRWPPPVAALVAADGPLGELYVFPKRGPNDPDRAFISAVNRSVLFGALDRRAGGGRVHAGHVQPDPQTRGTPDRRRAAHGAGRSLGAGRY